MGIHVSSRGIISHGTSEGDSSNSWHNGEGLGFFEGVMGTLVFLSGASQVGGELVAVFTVVAELKGGVETYAGGKEGVWGCKIPGCKGCEMGCGLGGVQLFIGLSALLFSFRGWVISFYSYYLHG